MASKINFIVRMQHWMDSVPGQTFLNYAYSWGASIVILGALFKLTHLPGADLMLFIGMGTEVFVFFISAFDRPFDKNEANKELADDYLTDEEIAAGLEAKEKPTDEEENTLDEEKTQPETAEVPAQGTTIIIGGGGAQAAPAAGGAVPAAANAPATPMPAGGGVVAGTQVVSASAAMDPEALAEATRSYIEKLQDLTEVLQRVEEQSRRLTTDSEEMTNLNRTLTGINTVYELQLRSVSSQIGTIDQINEQTRRMAEQIEQLNAVYARMIRALTVNMKNAAGAAGVEP